ATQVFGIYLVHIFFFRLLGLLGITGRTFQPMVWIPFLAVVIFGCSLTATLCLRKIPGIGKWIV
ncbi:MAG: hypothetical protein Q4E67_05265, partial [Planctomycetia bacterium]|nr:hypothetical protein [Planctomycetia bacterium]